MPCRESLDSWPSQSLDSSSQPDSTANLAAALRRCNSLPLCARAPKFSDRNWRALKISDLSLKRAFDEAFVSGYHDVIWVSVGLALLSAVSAQLIQSKRRAVSADN